MYYRGDHSITFYDEDFSLANGNATPGMYHTGFNTWTDFHMAPTSRPEFSPPPIKSTYVEVPYRDGAIDLTTALTHRKLTTYGNRTGTWEFIIPATLSNYPYDKHFIMNALHGLRKKIISSDDPNFYYTGRITVDSWQNNTDGTGNQVTLGYTLDPYKICRYPLLPDIKWNDINFDTDTIDNQEIFDYGNSWSQGISFAKDEVKTVTIKMKSNDFRYMCGPTPVKLTFRTSGNLTYKNTAIAKVSWTLSSLSTGKVVRAVTEQSYTSVAVIDDPDLLLFNRDDQPILTLVVTPYYECKMTIQATLRCL